MKTLFGALLPLLLFTTYSHAQVESINSGEILIRGVREHEKKNYKKAIEIYRQVPRNDTNYAVALYEIALSANLDSNYSLALQMLTEGLTLEENNIELDMLQLRATTVDDMGDTEKAIVLLDSAMIRYPNSPRLKLAKGISLMRLEKYADAQQVFQQLLVENPFHSSAHFRIGICALQQGQIAKGMMSMFTYLVNSPSGPLHTNAIRMLSEISKNTDYIRELVDKRTVQPTGNFALIEQILFSKIALDKNYKQITKFDDPIIRQLQVMMEKLQFDAGSTDFWMQFYVPCLKAIFDKKLFNEAVYHAFSNVDAGNIQSYVKKNEKKIVAAVKQFIQPLDQIRTTRELNYTKRQQAKAIYHFDKGSLFGKGLLNANGKLEGSWVFYYDNGNIKSTGTFNSRGEKTGRWDYYYPGGAISGYDYWIDGQQHGEDVIYNKQGVVTGRVQYVNGKMDGEKIQYYALGNPRNITTYRKGVEDGIFIQFYPNGRKKTEGMVANGKFHGLYKSFYENGRPEMEVHYENGDLHGPYKSFHDNGQPHFEGSYVKGKPEGQTTTWHKNGVVKVKLNYVNGEPEGDELEYNDRGELVMKSFYKKGKTHGLTEYFRAGRLYSTLLFDNDILKEAKYFDSTGKEISSSARKNKVLDLTVYSPEGFKRSFTRYSEKTGREDMQYYYYTSGQVKESNPYRNGELNGVVNGYFANGNKWYEISYREGKKHGLTRYYHINGKLSHEYWYSDNVLNGDWKEYDEKGILTVHATYLKGDLHGVKTWYYPNGMPDDEQVHYYGWLRSVSQYDSLGNKYYTATFKNGNGRYDGYHFNGNKQFDGAYEEGELHGKFLIYFFDGSVSTEKHYDRGILDGDYTEYQYGGKPSVSGQYSLGKKTGVWKYYNSKGKLWKEESYLNDELHGMQTIYFSNGKTEKETNFRHGDKHGESRRYAEDGQLMSIFYFEEGSLAGYSYNGKDGKPVPMIPFHGENGKITTYFSNGSVSSEMEYLNGRLHGDFKLYFSDGKLNYHSREICNHTDGKVVLYYPGGQVKYEYNYIIDERDGPFREYHSNGKLSHEGNYISGRLHGDYKFYNENGKLTETRVYYYGTLIKIVK